MWTGLIHHYRSFLPVTDATPVVSLCEGNTPLIPLTNYVATHRLPIEWYVKFEGLNPTGSFKDRGMTMAITKAKEDGARVVMCASTGNTSASAAAYAAKAQMGCVVLIPDGKIALGKLSQAMMHGAQVVQIEGNFDEALQLVRDITHSYPITLVNSVNPYRIEGQKTGAFEVVDALGDAPHYHTIPVGNAGNITAYWKGYTEYWGHQRMTRLPKMLGFQASGAAPLVHGHPIEHPETIATAIRIGNPASWSGAMAAVSESNGLVAAVTDEEMTQAQIELARYDGVFVEPASAASVAGVLQFHRTHGFEPGSVVVSVVTGHGLKDPNRAIEISPSPVKVGKTQSAILSVIEPLINQVGAG